MTSSLAHAPSAQRSKPAWILLRYVLRDCVSFFSLALAAFIGVLITVQLLRVSDLIVNRGVAAQDIALMFIAAVPTFLELALPMAAVIGIMLAIARLSSDAELIVMRGSGVSLFQVLPAALILGGTLTIIGLLVSHYAKPWGHRTVNQVLFSIARDSTTAGLEIGTFNNLGRITIYPEGIDYNTGELKRVLLDERGADVSDGRRIFFAERGFLRSDATQRSISLELFEGEIHEQQRASPSPGVPPTNRSPLNYSVTRFSSNSVDLSPAMLGTSESNEEAPVKGMSRTELKAQLRWYEETLASTSGFGGYGIPLAGATRELIGMRTSREINKRIGRIEIELATRWSMPFASLVLALLAFALGVQPPRGRGGFGVGASLIVGLGVFLLYYGLLAIGFAFAEKQTLSATASAWFPNLVAALISIWVVFTVCSERSASAADALRELANRLRTATRRLLRQKEATS